MKCLNCGAPVKERHNFCSVCGLPLGGACPRCGQRNGASASFCAGCGELLQPSPLIEATAERRQLSVMFCDLVGSTELSSRLDPEDLREIMTIYQGVVASSARRFCGFIAKYLGDGVLIYFGWPEASENDAERAVHAGLEIIDKVALMGSSDLRLSVRIGIATGLVVVGEEIGQGPAYERGVIGHTPNVAARLQSVAAPATVIVDQATRVRLGDLFDFVPISGLNLRGFAEPLPAWHVSDKRPFRSRFEALRTGALTPLVGRDEDLQLLLRRWEHAKQGGGRVVLVCGEPGIGKSRLISDLSRAIERDRHFRLRYFCSPHLQDSALYPIIAHLEDAAQFRPGDNAAERLRKLRAMLDLAQPSDQDVALIADLLSIQDESLPALTFSPRRKRELTSAALNRQLAHLSRVRPLLMLFEDAHWWDPTTRDLIDFTIDAVPDLRILLVITYRPELQPNWIGKPNVSLISLGRLDHDQAAEVASHVAALSPSILKRIAARSDGIPLFIEELAKSILESDAGTSPAAQGAVPPTLQASLMSRLDRLPAAKQIAQIGAAIGREFPYDLIAAVAAIPDPALRERLNELVGAGLVFCRGHPPDSTYAFKHALVQDAAYETMLRRRRIGVHTRILNALLHSDPDLPETHPALLGHHAAQAGLTAQGARYFLRAGQLSAERSAMVEARANLTHGLDLAAGLPEGPERQLLEAELQVALSNVQMAVLGFGATAQEPVLAKALALCRGLGSAEPKRPILLSRTLYGEWSHKLHTGPLEFANAVAREFAELGDGSDDFEIKLMGLTTLATSLFLEGRPAEARAIFASVATERAIEECRTANAGFGVDATTLFHAQFSRALSCIGLVKEAKQQSETAVNRARRLQHLPSIALSLSATCTTAWVLRELPTLEARAGTLVQIAEEQGFSFWQARGQCYAGWIAAQRDRLDEAVALLETGISALRSSCVTLYVPE
ncbi:MAG: AAA family ATPase, partial [Acetobacteraceae bacterium]|nr:AAA family ATPase [Acetobacteraceae bacterium]